jgi:uncharacterized RDD family membrane protein YckC
MSRLIDLILIGTLAILTAMVGGVGLWLLMGTDHPVSFLIGNAFILAGGVIIWMLLLLLSGFAYSILLRKASGCTLGEFIWGVRLLQEDGSPPDGGAVVARELASVVSMAVCGAGYWWVLFHPQGRTWHGILSRTRVVEKWPPFSLDSDSQVDYKS